MLQYIIKLSISLSIVYLFYQLFLRKLTFYNWNRWYLLIYSIVCFVIPFINVFTIIVKQPALRESAFINYIPAITQMANSANGTTIEPGTAGISWMQVTIMVIAAGMLFMLVRLLLQYYSLYKMRSKAVLLYEDKVKLYHIDEPVMPFSFGRGIYVNQHQHGEDELKEIIRHEFIHVKQRHSLDIIWSEVLCILNWYNPFAWLLRHDIRQNLEFIADQQVLQTGLDRKQYQYLLLKVIGVNSFSIATNFNFSSLKKRIAMMNKAKSARVHLIRFLFLLPLLIIVLLAFRNATRHDQQQPVKALVTDTIPAAVKVPAAWKNVLTIDVTDEKKVTLRLKDGKIEKYDLNIPAEKEAFERQYGALPEPPSPPATPGLPTRDYQELLPVAPDAPGKPAMPEAPGKIKAEPPSPPEAPKAPVAYGVPTAPEAPEPPEKATINFQDCLNKKGYCITIADNYGESIVIVKDKNNKIVEAIPLTDWSNDKKYEEKYGEILARPAREWKRTDDEKQVTRIEADEIAINKPNELLALGGPVKVKTAVGSKVEVMANRITVAKPKPVTTVKADPVVVYSKMADVKYSVKAKVAVGAKPVTEIDKVIVVKAMPVRVQRKIAVERVPDEPKAPARSQKPSSGQPEQE